MASYRDEPGSAEVPVGDYCCVLLVGGMDICTILTLLVSDVVVDSGTRFLCLSEGSDRGQRKSIPVWYAPCMRFSRVIVEAFKSILACTSALNRQNKLLLPRSAKPSSL